MLSRPEIEVHITEMSSALSTLAQGPGDLACCLENASRFQALRGQYSQQPATLADRVQELSRLSRRFDELLAARLPQVVDRFHAVTAQIHSAEPTAREIEQPWPATVTYQVSCRSLGQPPAPTP